MPKYMAYDGDEVTYSNAPVDFDANGNIHIRQGASAEYVESAIPKGVCYMLTKMPSAVSDFRVTQEVPPINSARMADLSADMFDLGVCDGGD